MSRNNQQSVETRDFAKECVLLRISNICNICLTTNIENQTNTINNDLEVIEQFVLNTGNGNAIKTLGYVMNQYKIKNMDGMDYHLKGLGYILSKM